MVSTPRPNPHLNKYLTCVIVAGAAVILTSIAQLVREPIGVQWFILAALTVISGSASVRLPSSAASISISETFVITGVLLYGPAAGTTLTAIDGLVISFWISRRSRRDDQLYRALFNVSAPAFSAWCSAHIFFLAAQVPPLVQEPASINAILPALILFALTYFGLNSWLVTFAIAIERHSAPIKIWTSHFLLLSLNYFAGASVAILFVGFTRTIDLGYIGIILPLLLVLYFTFKATMSRVEDANKYVDEINKLYLSTIETFAMAIDAKDQVTHGHIRRVQRYAVALANELGVRDELLLKAIEAAALLHDMGKLAVPEFILNKPGKLTPHEFERMKLHAAVGADILSAVEFPYPVVPMVRHHHENWDGTGYPSGLKGTEIPIGARILSVVDCFDALTSDRPYRARLSDYEALRIVLDRRGSMYDPLIVDTFVQVLRRLGSNFDLDDSIPQVVSAIATGHKDSSVATASNAPTPMADDIGALYDLMRELQDKSSFDEIAVLVSNHIRSKVPVDVVAIFLHDSIAAEIEIRYSSGNAESLDGLRIPLGQRLSGWVAANRQSICNSDPILDFGHDAPPGTRVLRSCLSTPIVQNDTLVGVLSLYSRQSTAFADIHRRSVEMVVREVAAPILEALERDTRTPAKSPPLAARVH